MKILTAIIRPYKLDDVREALLEVGVQGSSITEVQGYGQQKGHDELYRGAEYVVDLLPKVKMEVALRDEQLEDAIAAVLEAAASGRIGDGKVFVFDLKQTYQIRTGETDNDAL